MKAKHYPARNCYRVFVPRRYSENGREIAKYFKTKELAEEWIRGLLRPTTDQQRAKLNQDLLAEYYPVCLSAQKRGLSGEQLFEALNYYVKTVLSVTKKARLLEAAELWIETLEHEEKNPRTIMDYRRHVKELCDIHGALQCIEFTSEQLRTYLRAMPPGTTRQTKRKNLRVFMTWLKESGYTATHLMENIPAMDSWGAKTEILSIEDYRRILSVCGSCEPIAKFADRDALEEDKKITERYKGLLAFYVLGGLAGIRRCEMISSYKNDPTIEWADILWREKLIIIRDDVAKQTNKENRKRYIPLEPAAFEWLFMVQKKSGPIIEISQTQFQRLNGELLDKLGIEVPDNGLRNSYASYGQSCRSPGDVAKAMGDLESTIRRYYVQTLKPDAGQEWFNSVPYGPLIPAAGKILQIEAA